MRNGELVSAEALHVRRLAIVHRLCDVLIRISAATGIIEYMEKPFRVIHQVIDSNLVVVELKLRHRDMLFFLLYHFPHETALVEVILHLLVERVDDKLFEVVALIALETKKIQQDDRVDVAAVGKDEKSIKPIIF